MLPENTEPLLTRLLLLLQTLQARKIDGMGVHLVRALDALPSVDMKKRRFQEWLLPLPDIVALELLECLVKGAQADRPRFRPVLLSILNVAPLIEELGGGRLERWRLLAQSERLPHAYSLINPAPPKKRYYAPRISDVNEQMEDTPLGWRKTLARGQNRQVLDRLLYDKHPMVIRILLGNPSILERDVVKMATLQPTSARALTVIFEHLRWIRRYSVKKALVFNPYAPIAMVQALLGFLHEQDLQLASRTYKLSKEVRESAEELLELRRSRRRVALSVIEPEPLPETHRKRKKKAPPTSGVSATELAARFLCTMPEAEDALRELGLSSDEGEDANELAEDFLEDLPDSLPLVPVTEERGE